MNERVEHLMRAFGWNGGAWTSTGYAGENSQKLKTTNFSACNTRLAVYSPSVKADREQLFRQSLHICRMRAFLAFLALAVCGLLQGAEPGTNLIAIYLLDRPLAQPWPKLDRAHLKDLKTVSPPALVDSDFVAFDLTNHTFIITGAAAKRLSLNIWSLATRDAPGWGNQVPYVHWNGEFELIPVPAPFVLKAFGDPIYAGAFFTSVSSTSFSGPVILADKVFIKTNVPESARFSFSIELGYPAAFAGTPDPRGDARVVTAVQKLFADTKH